MNLRKKTLLIICLTLFGMLVLLYAISRTIWLRSYQEIENRRLTNHVIRAHNLLLEERQLFERTAKDNAEWDELYAFMQKPVANFSQSNYPAATLALLRTNFLILLDTSGAVVLSLGCDPLTNAELSLPAVLQKHFVKDSMLVRLPLAGKQVSGILQLPQAEHLMLAACPILTSDGRGPIRGVLVMARYWGAEESKRITSITQMSSRLETVTDSRTELREYQFAPNTSWAVTDSVITLRTLNADSIAGRVVLPDLYGQPTLALQVTMARTVSKQGHASILYFMSALLVCGVIFGAVVMLLLEKAVISRFTQLSAEVNRIGLSQDPTLRATLTGADEISQLTTAINKMLASLQHFHEKLLAENQMRERTEQELKRSQEELRSLSAHLEILREEERAHIAREIHDELGQVLSSLRMDLRTLENHLAPDQRELLNLTHSMSELIYLTIQRVKKISQELRPSVLEHLAFAQAVSWQIESFMEKYNLSCELALENVAELKLNRHTSSELFRVLQEALTNIVRHAEATQVRVALEKTTTHLTLSIEDNGKGMNSRNKNAPPSFGLLGMRERMHRLKGHLEIISPAERGTTILASIPVTNLEAA